MSGPAAVPSHTTQPESHNQHHFGAPNGFHQQEPLASNIPRSQGSNPWLGFDSMDGNIAGPSKPFQVGGNQAGQGSGMGLSNNGNTGATSVYPPQPYGPASGQQSLPTPTRTSSPSNVSSNSNGKGKATDGSNSTNGSSRKRMASSSPGNEGSKEKRSRPEDGSGEGLGSSPSGKVGDMYGGAPTPDGRVWGEEATKLDVYVWDYLTRRGFAGAAKALMGEAGMAEPPEVPLRTPQGLLFEYWAIFWDVFAARTGRGSPDATAYYECQENRQVARLREATHRSDLLVANFNPAENNQRFPSILVGQQADPPNAAAAASVGSQASIARPGGQQWNPAALNPQQQQQLLLMAAHRNNISAEELKHINPQTRMALINSMNPNNGGAQTQLRPGGAQFEQQMQARMRQQQLLQQQMMQRNAHQQSQQVGSSNGMQVRPPPPGQGHPMAVGSPAPGPASMLGSGVSTPAAGQAGSEGGRRSQGPMQGPQPGTPGLQHARSEQAHAMQTSQGGDGQQPQLNPQQQQAVMQQYQQTQALLKAEYAKATNAPNPAMAQQFYTNAQTLQNRIQSLQALLKAQPNLQQQAQMQAQQQAQARGVGAGQMGGPMQMGGQQAGQGQQPGQQQHMMVNGMAGMTPQQRAAQLANAQAAASRITPAMAANDPGLMASIMGPGGGMPNGSGTPRPPQGPHNGMQQPNAQGTGPQGPMGQLGQQQSGQLGQHQQQQQQQHLVGFDYHNTTAQIEAQRARTAAMQQGGGMAGMQNAGSPFQHGGGQRPSSHQGGVQEDPNQSHFAAVSSAGGQGQPTRPTMQRTPSSIGMGPPGPQHASSPSPRNQPGNLASGAQNAGSPSYPVPNTPKMGGAEKPKKKESRQRKNSKAASKTPLMTSASIPSTAGNSGPGGAAASTPTQPPTPASSSVPTPGRERDRERDGATAATPGRGGKQQPGGAQGLDPSQQQMNGMQSGMPFGQQGQQQGQQGQQQGAMQQQQNEQQQMGHQQQQQGQNPAGGAVAGMGMSALDGFAGSGVDGGSNDPPATGVTGAGGAGASVGGGGANGGDDFSNMFAGSDFFDFDFGMPSAGDSGTGNGASGFGDWGSFDSNLFGGADNGLSGAGAS